MPFIVLLYIPIVSDIFSWNTISFLRANRLGCINQKWPDLYGHYREAKLAQIKHHWWWKANRIFNELKVTKNYKGRSRKVLTYTFKIYINKLNFIS